MTFLSRLLPLAAVLLTTTSSADIISRWSVNGGIGSDPATGSLYRLQDQFGDDNTLAAGIPPKFLPQATPAGNAAILFSREDSFLIGETGFGQLQGATQFTVAITFRPDSIASGNLSEQFVTFAANDQLISGMSSATGSFRHEWAVTLSNSAIYFGRQGDGSASPLLTNSRITAPSGGFTGKWWTAVFSWTARGAGENPILLGTLYDQDGNIAGTDTRSLPVAGRYKDAIPSSTQTYIGGTPITTGVDFDGAIARIEIFDTVEDAAPIARTHRSTHISEEIRSFVTVTNLNSSGPGSLQNASTTFAGNTSTSRPSSSAIGVAGGDPRLFLNHCTIDSDIEIGSGSDLSLNHTAVQGSLNGSGIITRSSLIRPDLSLELLANNGGLTNTRRAKEGSPLIDAGDFSIANPPTTDARGFVRKINGTIDIGATEHRSVSPANAAAQDIQIQKSPDNPDNLIISWSAQSGVQYRVESSTDLVTWELFETVDTSLFSSFNTSRPRVRDQFPAHNFRIVVQ